MIGTGMAAETAGTAAADGIVVNVGVLLFTDEAEVVLFNRGLLLRPGLLLMMVGDGGCCFFLTAWKN